ncbi:hypothetical protein CsatB_015100 [Cannabis sativa]
MKDLGDASFVLGIHEIRPDRCRGILDYHKRAISIKYSKGLACKIVDHTPVAKGDKYSLSDQCRKSSLEIEEMKRIPYASTVGSLMYLQKEELKMCVQKEEETFKVFAATEIPTCCRLEVVTDGREVTTNNKREKSKERFQTVRRRMKRLLCGNYEGDSQSKDNFNNCNVGGQFFSFGTRALMDARCGFHPPPPPPPPY